MSSHFFDPMWREKIRIPVKRVGGNWEFFYGGNIPIKDGTIGELTVESTQITDKNFFEMLNREVTVQVFDENVSLFVALSDPKRTLPWTADISPIQVTNLPPGTTRLERVILGPPKKIDPAQNTLIETKGGLWLKQKGLEKSEIITSKILLTGDLAGNDAISLNHAFTQLSEKFETHRISHTGNIYTRILYQEADQRWYPLARMRDGFRVDAEDTLMGNVWRQIELALGWG